MSSLTWDDVIKAVSYPVETIPLFYQKNDEYHKAEGITNTGRDTIFFGVVVTDWDGDSHCISVVTDTYDTIPAYVVYDDLRNDLDKAEIPHTIVHHEVSGNLGAHRLMVKFDNCVYTDPNSENDEYVLGLRLNTSIDGKSKHVVQLAVFKNDVRVVGLCDLDYTVSGRHTKTITERHAAFSTIISGILEAWQDTIIPLIIMTGAPLDKQTITNMLDNLLDLSAVGEKHKEKVLALYHERKRDSYTYLDAIGVVSEYFQESLANRPERLNVLTTNIAKNSSKIISKLKKELI